MYEITIKFYLFYTILFIPRHECRFYSAHSAHRVSDGIVYFPVFQSKTSEIYAIFSRLETIGAWRQFIEKTTRGADPLSSSSSDSPGCSALSDNPFHFRSSQRASRYQQQKENKCIQRVQRISFIRCTPFWPICFVFSFSMWEKIKREYIGAKMCFGKRERQYCILIYVMYVHFIHRIHF